MNSVVTFKLNKDLDYGNIRFYDAYINGVYAHAWVEELTNSTKNTYRSMLADRTLNVQCKTMEQAQNALITYFVTRRMTTCNTQ